MLEQGDQVIVIYGGRSAEREVSLRTGDAVLHALRRLGFEVTGFDPATDDFGVFLQQKFAMAFIALHGRGGEDGAIQGFLETLNIPFTGSGVLASAMAMDKITSKLIFSQHRIATPGFKIVEKSTFHPLLTRDILAALGEKVVVKPAREGSSIGMAISSGSDALKNAIEEAFIHDDRVLLEAFIAGEEYTVSIVGDVALPSIRMSTPHEFYDYSAKYQSSATQYFCPSGLSARDEACVGEIALGAFRALQCDGWGRVDLIRDENGQFWVLEVNTIPGMTTTSLVPKAAVQVGMSFDDLVLRILHARCGR